MGTTSLGSIWLTISVASVALIWLPSPTGTNNTSTLLPMASSWASSRHVTQMTEMADAEVVDLDHVNEILAALGTLLLVVIGLDAMQGDALDLELARPGDEVGSRCPGPAC